MKHISCSVFVVALGVFPPATLHPAEPHQVVRVTPPASAPTTTTIAPSPRLGKRFNPVWLNSLPVPSMEWWDVVAQCETAGNWKDGGRWAGGLGIYFATWRWFGGKAFGKTPDKATREEQITIANRIALKGHKPVNGKFREPVGFNGWGCVRNNETINPPVDEPWVAEARMK